MKGWNGQPTEPLFRRPISIFLCITLIKQSHSIEAKAIVANLLKPLSSGHLGYYLLMSVCPFAFPMTRLSSVVFPACRDFVAFNDGCGYIVIALDIGYEF